MTKTFLRAPFARCLRGVSSTIACATACATFFAACANASLNDVRDASTDAGVDIQPLRPMDVGNTMDAQRDGGAVDAGANTLEPFEDGGDASVSADATEAHDAPESAGDAEDARDTQVALDAIAEVTQHDVGEGSDPSDALAPDADTTDASVDSDSHDAVAEVGDVFSDGDSGDVANSDVALSDVDAHDAGDADATFDGDAGAPDVNHDNTDDADTLVDAGPTCGDGICDPAEECACDTDCGLCCEGESTEACGLCGTRSRVCDAERGWSDWGACEFEGYCRPGDLRDCEGGYEYCTNGCGWSACVDESVRPTINSLRLTVDDLHVYENESVCVSAIVPSADAVIMRPQGYQYVAEWQPLTSDPSTEFVIYITDGPRCTGTWQRDVWGASYVVRANGVALSRCSERTNGDVRWRSFVVSWADGWPVVDAGEMSRCPLTPVRAGDGVAFEIDGASVLPDEVMCLSLMYPGLHGWTVPRQSDGRYALAVALLSPATLEFVWYAAAGNCEGSGQWRRDYWASVYDVAVDGERIAGCVPRVDNPVWSAMRALLGATGVADASTMECP